MIPRSGHFVTTTTTDTCPDNANTSSLQSICEESASFTVTLKPALGEGREGHVGHAHQNSCARRKNMLLKHGTKIESHVIHH